MRDNRRRAQCQRGRVTRCRAGEIGDHHIIVPLVLRLQPGQRQRTAGAAFNRCPPEGPFVAERLYAGRHHFECKGAAQVRIAPNWLRHDDRRLGQDNRDRGRPNQRPVLVHRQLVLPRNRLTRVVQRVSGGGCLVDRRSILAPPVGQRLGTRRRDGQLHVFPINHGDRPGQLNDRPRRFHCQRHRFTGIRADFVGDHNLILPGDRVLHVGQAQGIGRYVLDQFAGVIPLVTERLGAGRRGGQHHAVSLGQDSAITPRVGRRFRTDNRRRGQLSQTTLHHARELHAAGGDHDGQRGLVAGLLAERHRFAGICLSLVRDHDVILP